MGKLINDDLESKKPKQILLSLVKFNGIGFVSLLSNHSSHKWRDKQEYQTRQLNTLKSGCKVGVYAPILITTRCGVISTSR